MDDFNRKRHAVYKLTYHAVFVIKYRRKVMSEPIIEHMRQYAAHLIGQCYQGAHRTEWRIGSYPHPV